MGRRKIELTEAQKAEVETLAAVLSLEQIADYFGISESVFARMRKEDPQIARDYKRGKSRAIQAVASGLLADARDGCKTSRMFYLKTQAGWRETQKIEHSGGLQVNVIQTFADLDIDDHS